MVAEHFRLVSKVVGVDADAVAADQTGLELEEVPFGASSFEHLGGVDAELVED